MLLEQAVEAPEIEFHKKENNINPQQFFSVTKFSCIQTIMVGLYSKAFQWIIVGFKKALLIVFYANLAGVHFLLNKLCSRFGLFMPSLGTKVKKAWKL